MANKQRRRRTRLRETTKAEAERAEYNARIDLGIAEFAAETEAKLAKILTDDRSDVLQFASKLRKKAEKTREALSRLEGLGCDCYQLVSHVYQAAEALSLRQDPERLFGCSLAVFRRTPREARRMSDRIDKMLMAPGFLSAVPRLDDADKQAILLLPRALRLFAELTEFSERTSGGATILARRGPRKGRSFVEIEYLLDDEGARTFNFVRPGARSRFSRLWDDEVTAREVVLVDYVKARTRDEKPHYEFVGDLLRAAYALRCKTPPDRSCEKANLRQRIYDFWKAKKKVRLIRPYLPVSAGQVRRSPTK